MKLPYKVYVTTLHPGDAVDYLGANLHVECSNSSDPISEQTLHSALATMDGVVTVIQDRFDEAVFKKFPHLKVVSNVAVGFDNINVDDATRNGVLVCNTPGVLDNTTADLAFGLLLSAARRIVEADKYVRDGKWQRWTFDLLLGTDLGGKTLGIIGLGRIGQAMARRALGFGMNIMYTQRTRALAEVEANFNAHYVPMDELLSKSDFISIHCPLNNATRHLLSDREFDLMKPSAILVNTARGAIIDERALVKALQSGKICAAGLDVFENEPVVSEPLLKMDNVVLAPHIGSASTETRSAMAKLAAEGVVNALAGRLPENAVNPEVWPVFLQRLSAAVK
jgi:glyoxylate reductase